MENGVEEVSLDGFQIVKSEMFIQKQRKSDGSCSIWPNKISFSRTTLRMLNNCEYIRLEVNPNTKCLLVVPTHSSDKDSIRWLKGQKDPHVRDMESKEFGDEIYKAWGFDRELNYRAIGKLVIAQSKIMMLFDFTKAMTWKTKQMEKTSE